MLLQKGKALAAQQTKKDGRFSFSNVPDGCYNIEVSSLGYETVTDSLCVPASDQSSRIYYLPTLAVELGEAQVVQQVGQTVTQMANGKRFTLSAKAKKERNPFVALREIPLLRTDINTSSITLADGSSPLILIDGNLVNSGVSPILPADIESVEVINAVSARYLQMGVKSIVNITTKKKANPYVWVEGATRHDVPLDQGFGALNFEIGNPKVSLYGNVAYNYTYHEDTETTVNRENTNYKQEIEQAARTNGGYWVGQMLLKYSPSSKDYLAVQAYTNISDSKTRQHGSGTYTPLSQQPLAYALETYGHNDASLYTTSLYYKHLFDASKSIELSAYYNYNTNDYETSRTDRYGDTPYSYASLFNNKRQSGSFDIDYSQSFSNGASLSVGSHTMGQHNEIDNHLIVNNQPTLFRHRHLNQYLYAGYSGQVGNKFYYMASVGVEGIWQDAGGYNSHYFRPRGSVSAVWSINGKNSLQLSYNLTNTAPSISQLNPINISTDSLVAEVGNPYLKPQMMHYIELSHTAALGRLYLMPKAYYKRITDLLNPLGFTNDRGVYTNTYTNLGHFSQALAGLTVSYAFKWGQIYGGAGWYSNYFEGQEAKNMYYISWGMNARVKKFSFYGNLSYSSRDYTAISYTQYKRPSIATLQVNYNFSPDFWIGVCLQHFTGLYNYKTYVNDGSFRSTSESRFKDQRVRPFVIIRYTFRKNLNRRIRMGDVFSNWEKGINVQRDK